MLQVPKSDSQLEASSLGNGHIARQARKDLRLRELCINAHIMPADVYLDTVVSIINTEVLVTFQ